MTDLVSFVLKYLIIKKIENFHYNDKRFIYKIFILFVLQYV